MTHNILAVIISFVALICSSITTIIALFIQARALRTQQSALLSAIRDSIVSAEHRVESFAPNDDATIRKQQLDAAIEQLLNAYDSACSKYLLKMVDKKEFESMYKREIRDLMESSPTKELLDGNGTPFRNIVRVYNRWQP